MTEPLEETKFVNAVLTVDQIAELEAIKKYHGIKTTADAIRFMIRSEARRIYYPSALPGMDVRKEASR